MGLPAVSIIVVHYRGLEILRRCLESLFNTNYENFRVILVDNGSNDGSFEYVRRVYCDRVTVMRNEVNLGFVAGNNLALAQVKSKYVVLLNDDTAVEPNWLKYLVEVGENDPSVGACQPKLLSLADPRFFEYNGCAGGMLDVYGVPFCRGRVFDVVEEDCGQYDKLAEVFWAGGAAIFIRREVLDLTGLLDEMFYAQMEEIDLCWRIRLLGYKVMSVPKSVAYHLGGGTLLPEKLYLKHRNNLIMMLKNYSVMRLLRYFTFRMVLDIMSFVYFLVSGDGGTSFCIKRAYVWLLRNLRRVYENRCRVQGLRRVSDRVVLGAMVKRSVAVQFYLMGRRLFRKLGGMPYPSSYYMVMKS